jgi:hypothetical protein
MTGAYAIAAASHMWTAPSCKRFERVFNQIACHHMSDLLMRRAWPLAKMVFAMRVPNTKTTSEGQWKARSVPHPGSINQSTYSFPARSRISSAR